MAVKNVIKKVVWVRGAQVLVVVTEKQFNEIVDAWSKDLINPEKDIIGLAGMVLLNVIEITARRGKIGRMNIRVKIPKAGEAYRTNKYILKAFNKYIWEDVKKEVERRLKEKAAA